ncbi:hypothetical protein NX875_29415, partial [Burkholderia thailandensis]|nr:hypothetical protein [Burkholderia thailandensis]
MLILSRPAVAFLAVAGCVVDKLVGEPRTAHPLVAFGRLAARAEREPQQRDMQRGGERPRQRRDDPRGERDARRDGGEPPGTRRAPSAASGGPRALSARPEPPLRPSAQSAVSSTTSGAAAARAR